MIAVTQTYISCPLYMTYFENDIIIEGVVADFMKKVKKINFTKLENKIDKMKQKITDAGVDVKKIEQIVKSEVPKAVRGVKAGDTNAISEALKNIFTEMKENNLVKQIASAMKILVVVVVIHYFFHGFFLGLNLSKDLAFALRGIFVAPLLEEIGKYFSIKKKATGMYYVFFNIYEFATYIIKFMGTVSLPKLVGVRSLGLIFHATTTLFQKIQQEKGTPGKGLPMSILMHALWNGYVFLGTFLKYV